MTDDDWIAVWDPPRPVPGLTPGYPCPSLHGNVIGARLASGTEAAGDRRCERTMAYLAGMGKRDLGEIAAGWRT
jgi:hypothetical protein